MKKIIIAIFICSVQVVFAQTDTIKIQTTAVCEMCKETIEHDLSFVKGIVSSNQDVETKTLQVVFDPAKTNALQIQKEVTKIGYDADTLKADPKAFRKLPECCKKPHNE